MTDDSKSGTEMPDPAEWSETMNEIATRSQKIVSAFLERQAQDPMQAVSDPLHVSEAFMAMTARMMSDPSKLLEAQLTLWQNYMDLWQNTAQRVMGVDADPLVEPDRDDRRFQDEAWRENEIFDFIKQSYLLTSRWMQDVVKNVDGLDDHTAQKIDFYTRQFIDAMAPTNFVLTNPEVLRATVESRGDNLIKGLNNLLEDLERGKGQLSIKMTDLDAFKVGENIAVTPGKVIYQNDLLQLIHYAPTQKQVTKTPLLIVPPWINKFYILDLRPKNSFIKWCVDQGIDLYVISWVNPDEKLAQRTFEDYMTEGVLEALDVTLKDSGETQANAIGYCLGGTLLAATLAYMTAKKDPRVKSATFFTTMLDFEEPGELGVFIDEAQLSDIEEKMNERGYLDGREMATTFNMLRANDLIWSFVVNNYLLGKEPFPFDLLFWNSDSTRMPAAMHSFYLRKMYLENKLVEPGGVTLDGVPIDLTTVKTPSFFLSTQEDHIAPWTSTYRATQILSGPVRFTLAGSGHIAGVINPPEKNKYGFWSNDDTPADPEAFLKKADRHEGSWWSFWHDWLKTHADGTRPARQPGTGPYKAIEDAPGSYVKNRLT